MPILQDSDIADLVTGTLNDLGRMKFSQIAQNLTDYEVMSKWLRKDRVTFDDGRGIQRTLMHKLSGAASHVGLYQQDNVNVPELLTSISIPWVHARTYWIFERREMLMNKGKSLIVNIIKPRRLAAMIDMVEMLETRGWSLPTSSETELPYGIPYYIVKNATEGFNGGAPSGHSTVAGIDPDSISGGHYKNWTGTYLSVKKGDLIKTMRRGHRQTMWKSPVTAQEFRSEKGRRRRFYTNEPVLSDMEDVGEGQNENLGRDLAPMDNTMTFKRHPIIWSRKLDLDTENPVYGVDHEAWYPVVLKGDYLRESGTIQLSHINNNVFGVFVDLTYNFFCEDRHSQMVVYKATS